MPALKQCSTKIMEDNESDGKEDGVEEKQLNADYVSIPSVNVPEKIVFCIDVGEDASCTPYVTKTGVENPFGQLKRSLKSFIHNKHLLSSKHEYAVMSFEPGGNVKWIQEFSNDPETVIKTIDEMQTVRQSEPVNAFIMPVFKEIKEHVGSLPEVRISSVQLPKYSVRLIFIYNSSHNIPKINYDDELFNYFMSSNYFRLDILYLHDAPSKENKCQDIFDNLLSIASSGSYIFESSRRVSKLYNCMARLLAHPFQRYELPPTDD